MAIVAGPRGTGNVESTTKKPDWGDKILLLQPDAAPLTVISKRARKAPTINPDFNWAEDDLDVRFATTSTSYNNSATSIVVTSGQGVYFAQHDLVKVPTTGEVFRVTAVNTDTLTVVRGLGSSAASIGSGAELLVLGSAQPEGDTSKPAKTATESTLTNYCQIFRRSVESTETWRHSDTFFSQSDWDYQRGKYGIEHLKDIEEAFLFGKPSKDITGSQPRRSTGGVTHFVTTNNTNASGQLTETEFWGAFPSVFRYGSKNKWIFASGLVGGVLNAFPQANVVINDNGTGTYGVNTLRYQTVHGTLNLVTHWLLEGTTYGGYALILDMDNIRYRYLANSEGSRDSYVRENIQPPDSDTRKDEWLAEVGIEVSQEKTHGYIYGVTS